MRLKGRDIRNENLMAQRLLARAQYLGNSNVTGLESRRHHSATLGLGTVVRTIEGKWRSHVDSFGKEMEFIIRDVNMAFLSKAIKSDLRPRDLVLSQWLKTSSDTSEPLTLFNRDDGP